MRARLQAVLARTPFWLILTRFLIAAVLMMDAMDRRLSPAFVALFVFAVFSDYLDGFICRKIKLSSVQLSVLDGYADAMLYLSAGFCIWLVYPDVVEKYRSLLLALLLFQIASWLFSLVRFGRITSYHTYRAKIWGITLCLTIVEILIRGSGIFTPLMALVGGICIAEDVVMTAMMPYWKTGVLNIQTALRLRQTHKAATR